MLHEIETKILEVTIEDVIRKLVELGASKLQETRLIVDWYRPKGTQEGQDLWFLRIRSNSDGKHEVTWKAKSQTLGVSRKHKEINFFIEDPEKLSDLFEEIGLEKYAHQEKDRVSFSLNTYQFDIDTYPGMPTYMEIEGDSEENIKKAITLLGLENHKTWNQGERILIQDVYKLNWYHMKF